MEVLCCLDGLLDFTIMCNLNRDLIKPAPYCLKRKKRFPYLKKQTFSSYVAVFADSAAAASFRTNGGIVVLKI